MIYDYGMNYLGYNGLIATGERMVNALKNPSFAVKLARHRRLPYRRSGTSRVRSSTSSKGAL